MTETAILLWSDQPGVGSPCLDEEIERFAQMGFPNTIRFYEEPFSQAHTVWGLAAAGLRPDAVFGTETDLLLAYATEEDAIAVSQWRDGLRWDFRHG